MANGAIYQTRPKDAGKFVRRRSFGRDGEQDRMWGKSWFWLGTTAVVLSGLIAVWILRMVQESFFLLQNQHALIRATHDLFSALKDAESRQRGYLLTGQASYLESYNSSRKAVDSGLDRLRKLTEDNPGQRDQIERLAPLIQENLRELQESIRIRDAEGFNNAHALVLTSRHRELTDTIRRILVGMEDEEAALDRFERRRHSRLRAGLAALVGSASLAACSLLIGQIALSRNISGRQRAEEDLWASYSLNRSILDSLPANIAVVDGDGRIQTINEGWRSFARENGDPPASVVGEGADYLSVCRRSATDGSADAREALAGLEDVLAGNRRVFEMQYPCRFDSQTRWFRMIVSRLTGSAGGAVIVHVDLTERKQAEERFQLAVEAAPGGMVIVDQAGKIVLVNSRTEELFGYKRKELLGQPIEMLAPESSRERHATLRRNFFVHPRVRQMGAGRDLYGQRRDGTLFPLEIALNPIETGSGLWVLASILDITERRHTEEERQKFVSLADRSLEFVGMCDREFRPFYVNAAGLRLVGLDDLEAARRIKVQDCFFAEDQPFILEEFFPRMLREGHGKVEIRFRHFQTGEAIWMLFNAFNICDSSGATVGWATVSVNITERRRAESALEESRQELRALSGRLFLAQEEERKRISRELHDDLSQKVALLAFDTSSLALAPFPSPEEIRQSLRNLQTRIAGLSSDIRQIAHQLHPSILEDLGLTAALRELCDELSARETFHVAFEREALPEALPVDVASCLYRVAQEALHNVAKHARASQARLTVKGSPERVWLSIEDDGAGFDSEAHASGHRLGIISMKERVRLAQGEFSIHSQPGQGTTLTVSVPLPRRHSETSASTVSG